MTTVTTLCVTKTDIASPCGISWGLSDHKVACLHRRLQCARECQATRLDFWPRIGSIALRHSGANARLTVEKALDKSILILARSGSSAACCCKALAVVAAPSGTPTPNCSGWTLSAISERHRTGQRLAQALRHTRPIAMGCGPPVTAL